MLDTSVLVAGLRSRLGASYAVLGRVAEGRLRPRVSTALFLEYEAVLKRPDQVAVHGFTPLEVDRALAALAGWSEPVDIHHRWRPLSADPADDLVIETAVNGRADAVLTHNIRHLAGPARRFGVASRRQDDG